MRAHLFLFCFMVGISREKCSKFWKMIIFVIFLSVLVFLLQVFGQVNEWTILKLHEMIRMLHVVPYAIVFILFDDYNWQKGVLRLMKYDPFFSIFSKFSPFPQVFGQVKGWLLLKLHKIKLLGQLCLFCFMNKVSREV